MAFQLTCFFTFPQKLPKPFITEAISWSRLVVPEGAGAGAGGAFGGVAVEEESIEAASKSGEVVEGGEVWIEVAIELRSAWELSEEMMVRWGRDNSRNARSAEDRIRID